MAAAEDAAAAALAASLVPYRLSICGLGELDDFAGTGVSHVVSILDPGWPDPEAFRAFRPHRRVVWRFHDVVAGGVGMTPPAGGDVEAILAWSEVLAADGAEHVLVHCHAGVSRSTAAAVILLARDHPGREADAFAALAHLRPRSWPNARMVALADAALARDGALVAALGDHQRRVAGDHPEFADLLGAGGPAHEILGS